MNNHEDPQNQNQPELSWLKQRVSELEQQQIPQNIQIAQQKALFAVVTKIRESLDLESIFKSTAIEVRQLLNCDRVGMYRFDPDSNYITGQFVSEDVVPPYSSALAVQIRDHCFGTRSARQYHQGRIWAASNIYHLNLLPCHIKILAQFQVKANLVVPLLKQNQLWGLLCIHQCSHPREWQNDEIEFISQIAIHLGVALQQAEAMANLHKQSEQLTQEVAKAVEREKAVSVIINKIRRSLDLNTIFNTAANEIRQLLKADRVAIYRFNPDWSGEFVVDSVAEGWVSLLDLQTNSHNISSVISNCTIQDLSHPPIVDTYLQETAGGSYTRGEMYRFCHDIYQAGFSECYIEILSSYQARAYAVFGIYQGETLWGLLAAYQNSGPRQWQESDINFLAQISDQLGVATQQAELFKKVQQRSNELESTLEAQLKQRAYELAQEAERERSLAKVIDKIRRTLDLSIIFQTATTEVRSLLNVERVAIYKSNQNISGEFIFESSINTQRDSIMGGIWTHNYIQELYQNKFHNNQAVVVQDINTYQNISEPHRQLIQSLGFTSFVFIPIFKGEELWGLLAVFEQTGPRTWQEGEIKLLTQIASNLGVGVQQAELLNQTKRQSWELQTTLADLNAIVDNLADGLLVTDPQGKITRFNPALLDMFNLEGYNLKNQNLADIFPPVLVELANQSLKEQNTILTAEVELKDNRAGQALATPILKEAEPDEIDNFLEPTIFLGSVILIRDVTQERDLDRMKTDFLATVSHELRTPLTSVLGFASIIKEKLEEIVIPSITPDNRPVHKALGKILANTDIIVSEAERLTTLINDVLDIAKMEAGRIEWDIQPTDPILILEQAIAATSSLFEKTSLILVKDYPSQLPLVLVDCDRIIQVLINLLSNSVKFTTSGVVTCRAKTEGNNLVIAVSDTGRGIAPEDHLKVFDRFRQVGDILTDKPKGTGLGLPICKQIVEYHGGQIWLESILEQGATFYFTIPLANQRTNE